jgi:hypothetical protein
MDFPNRSCWLVLPLVFACAAEKQPSIGGAAVEAIGEPSRVTWELQYSDRSANGFHFWLVGDTAHFRYDPVDPIMSNSGNYSGGRANTGTLTYEQLNILRGMLDGLTTNTEAQVEQRTKGTGSVQITDNGTVERFLIAAHALDDFETFLDGFRGSDPQMLPLSP